MRLSNCFFLNACWDGLEGVLSGLFLFDYRLPKKKTQREISNENSAGFSVIYQGDIEF
jgi:hypothetical protein